MGVSGHLRIDVDEYDSRIRTFVPYYQELLGAAANALKLVSVPSPTIVDLGIGTGALAAACLALRPDSALIGVDSDAAMLDVAKVRLAGIPKVDLVTADFLEVPLPSCDAIVACLSLHHIRSGTSKRAFYAKCREALEPSGIMVSADCFPGSAGPVAAQHREAWLAHLEQTYTRAEAEQHLESWAGEDVYFPLEDELDWLRAAAFRPDVLWRMDGFAVVAAFPAP